MPQILPAQRAAALARERNLKMARSAHAYVRGNTVSFYEWLETIEAAKLPQGPAVWICGDCHLGNLGPLADTGGRVAVQIRDLDQTVIGNPAHDLVRLGLSLASAVRGSDLPGVTTARIMERLVAGYERALGGETEEDRPKSHRPRRIRDLIDHAVRRRWRHLAIERLDGETPKIPLGKRFWALTSDERQALRSLFEQPEVRTMITALRHREADTNIELIDAAYWMKGCSSLGRLRYAAMLRVGTGRKAAFCLIDVKEAVRAAAPRAPGAAMPRDNAQRVVAGARALSPNLGERMAAARLMDVAVVMRELLPQDLKLDVEQLTADESGLFAHYLGAVVGEAHARQMDSSTRASWTRELSRARKADLNAPSWLWTGVVELLSIHERAYLEHCRKFALNEITRKAA